MNATACQEIASKLTTQLLEHDKMMKTIDFSKHKAEHPWCQLAITNYYSMALEQANAQALELLSKYITNTYISGDWPTSQNELDD